MGGDERRKVLEERLMMMSVMVVVVHVRATLLQAVMLFIISISLTKKHHIHSHKCIVYPSMNKHLLGYYNVRLELLPVY